MPSHQQVPRITRQAVLDRLAGQHLALALHRSGLANSGAELTTLGQGRDDAMQAAIEQEERVYQLGKASKSVCPSVNKLWKTLHWPWNSFGCCLVPSRLCITSASLPPPVYPRLFSEQQCMCPVEGRLESV